MSLTKDEAAELKRLADVAVDAATNSRYGTHGPVYAAAYKALRAYIDSLTQPQASTGQTMCIGLHEQLNAGTVALVPTRPELTDEEWIELAIRDVAELPDRDSPADWPEAMLVTADELRNILADRAKRSKQ